MAGIYGGIEAGGTKFVCAVGTGPDDIREEIRFSTTDPAATIGRAISFFTSHHEKEPLSAIGIGSFGPVDLCNGSGTYGFIMDTPKPGWSHTDIAGTVERGTGISVELDTDVNAAALGESLWGAAQGLETFLYLTVGTGIGGGAMVNGSLLHGMAHPEMGHVLIPSVPGQESGPGSCPFHSDCLEGRASGSAMEKMWGMKPADIPEGHRAWQLEARFLASALVSYIYVLSPERIIMGGGVMKHPGLIEQVRAEVSALAGTYGLPAGTVKFPDSYIVPPGLGDRSGILGALALAMNRHNC